MQYTTGMGLGGGTLLSGWRGALFKEWTFATQITAGSGLPLRLLFIWRRCRAPASPEPSGRDYTGAPLYAAPAGLFLNPAAYTAPLAGPMGQCGTKFHHRSRAVHARTLRWDAPSA